MNRNEYINRVTSVISQLGEEKTDMILDKINTYLDAAGDENEAAAINALGVPEVFARRFVHTDGEYEIPQFTEQTRHGVNAPDSHEHQGIFTQSEKMAMKPKSAQESQPKNPKHAKKLEKNSGASSNAEYDSKRMIIMLSALIITSPIWLCFMALFVVIALVFAFVVVALLLIMSVGGAAMTVFGVIRLFSIFPVGMAMTGIGLLLLGVAGIAFLPLLKGSISLLTSTVKDIAIFVKNVINRATEPKSEVSK